MYFSMVEPQKFPTDRSTGPPLTPLDGNSKLCGPVHINDTALCYHLYHAWLDISGCGNNNRFTPALAVLYQTHNCLLMLFGWDSKWPRNFKSSRLLFQHFHKTWMTENLHWYEQGAGHLNSFTRDNGSLFVSRAQLCVHFFERIQTHLCVLSLLRFSQKAAS